MPDTEEKQPWYSAPRDLAEADARVKETAGGFIALAVIQAVLGFVLSPAVLADSAVYGFGGLWLRRSRRVSVAVVLAVAAVISGVVTVANRLGAGFAGGANIYLIPFLVVLSFQGIRSTVAYHRFAAQDPDYQPLARWPVVVLASLIIVLGGVSAYGYSLGPDVLVPGSSVSGEVRGFVESQLIGSDEQIVYFYAPMKDAFREAGTVMTDERVLAYALADGELLFGSFFFDEIADFRVEQAGSFWDVTYVEIDGVDGASLLIALPAAESEASPFMEQLRLRMSAARTGDGLPDLRPGGN